MNKLTVQKSVVGLMLIALMAGVAFSPLPTSAQAQSSADLQAQIQKLLAQIVSLQAQIAGVNQSTGAHYIFTRDLTVGATGVDVTALQKFLIGKGHAIPAGATGYFGPQTRAALVEYQKSQGISPAVGYFGPITRAKANIAPAGSDTDNGNDNSGGNNSDTSLKGGAGSISQYKLTSGYNNEEVGENAKDVEVAGLDIEVDNGSDIRLTALTLVFDEDTATTRFEKYADEVSIWLDGEEIARVDADVFNKNNNWTKTVSLKGDTVIKRGKTGNITVAISGARNIDSANLGHSWTVDFRSLRFTDAQGSSISEDPNTAVRTFSFESFATAADVKLKISKGDKDINDSRVINAHATNKTRDVNIMAFDIKIEGRSDVTLDSLPIEFTTTGADYLDEMASTAYLYMDGKRVGTENVLTDENTVVFDKLDLDLRAGKTYSFVVKVDLLPFSGALDEGDTISATIGETETDSSAFDAEDESGEELGDAEKTGSATGGEHIVYEAGILVSLVSTSETANSTTGPDNDYGTFVIKYRVEAFDGTVYVSTSPAATTSASIADATISGNGVLFLVDEVGTPVTDDLSSVISWKKVTGSPSEVANGVMMNEGDVVEFSLSVVRANNGDADDDGIFRVLLKAIGWNTDNSSTYNVYDFNLGNYKTDYLFLN